MSEALFQLGQKALILNENLEVLMVGSRKYDKNQELLWDLPGGRVDDGEQNLHDALARELDEELGITAEIHQLLSLTIAQSAVVRKPQILLAIYHCSIKNGEPTPANEISDLQWIPIDEVANVPRSRYTEETIKSIKQILDIN